MTDFLHGFDAVVEEDESPGPIPPKVHAPEKTKPPAPRMDGIGFRSHVEYFRRSLSHAHREETTRRSRNRTESGADGYR